RACKRFAMQWANSPASSPTIASSYISCLQTAAIRITTQTTKRKSKYISEYFGVKHHNKHKENPTKPYESRAQHS
ncbi:MAG: hypothetical protein DI615_06005, partial [Gardnerella vaginalis]